VLKEKLIYLREEGYELLSLSGGEPLLYPQLSFLIEHARALGFRVVAVSNGYRVRPRFNPLLESIDGVAISFDGSRDLHNQIRGRANAYEMAIDALSHLKRLAKPSAAVYSVSKESLKDIPEFVDLALEHGARAVQLRPLVMAGRARDECASFALTSADLDRLFLIGESLREAFRSQIAINTDLAYSQAIAASRDSYEATLNADARDSLLADLINPLVVTPDGTLKPFTYDFPQYYDLGSLDGLNETEIVRLKSDYLPHFRKLVEAVFCEIKNREEFIDWFAFCRDMAEEH